MKRRYRNRKGKNALLYLNKIWRLSGFNWLILAALVFCELLAFPAISFGAWRVGQSIYVESGDTLRNIARMFGYSSVAALLGECPRQDSENNPNLIFPGLELKCQNKDSAVPIPQWEKELQKLIQTTNSHLPNFSRSLIDINKNQSQLQKHVSEIKEVTKEKLYHRFINTLYLWSGVILLFIAFFGIRGTRRQIEISAQQSKANILLDLDKRWEGEELKTARKNRFTLEKSIKYIIEKSKPYSKNVDIETIYLLAIKNFSSSKYENYMEMMDLCGFFETVGYIVEKKYLDFDDIYQLYGPAIVQSGDFFRVYLESEQNIRGSEEYYCYFLRLYKRARHHHDFSARTPEVS